MTTAVKTERRRALERPHQSDHERSVARRMDKGRMPANLGGFLKWYADGWDSEVPTRLHKPEVWRDHGIHAEGGSKLGSPAWGDQFRRYMENVASECDEDGYFVRPMHAALSRIARRYPLTARALFAVAQSGYDWKAVALRGGWADEMFYLYLVQALTMLWHEHRDEVVRLT